MKKIILFCFFMFFCACFIANLYAHESDLEKQGSIVKAINEKPDLTGKDKDSIRLMFGYPVFRKKIISEKDKEETKEKELSARIVTGKKKGKAEEKKEIWVYRPFDYGEDKITITFTDGLVSDVEYKK